MCNPEALKRLAALNPLAEGAAASEGKDSHARKEGKSTTASTGKDTSAGVVRIGGDFAAGDAADSSNSRLR